MTSDIVAKQGWQYLGQLIGITLLAGCAQIASPVASQPEENPNNPYNQFRQAVNQVEPLLDPGLESLTANLQENSPTLERQTTVVLPQVKLLDVNENLTVTTASTLQDFNEQMYQRLIQSGYSGVFDINVTRAGAAIQQFCQDQSVNLLSVNRAMTPAEIQGCQGKGRQPLGLAIGKDPLLLVVNKQNDFVKGVTLEKLKAILTSRTWSQVDPSWPNVPIQRAMIGPNSSTVALLSQKLSAGAALLQAPGTTFYTYPEPLVQGLSTMPNAMAFINASIYERFTQTFRVIPINGISASVDTVESNAYPLVQSLFLYVDQKQLAPDMPTKAVANFYLTEMSEVMNEVGLLPLNQAQLDQTKNQWLKATTNN
ncbi:PstS family phosphate ABC transporter substrate-binding protein [Leptolyngbya ectocarpi]|nr:substrate-binding domain-containing protein [Leptolyngbya ectocarpi]